MADTQPAQRPEPADRCGEVRQTGSHEWVCVAARHDAQHQAPNARGWVRGAGQHVFRAGAMDGAA